MNLPTLEIIELAILATTTLYHTVASYQENRQPPPGMITASDRAIAIATSVRTY